MGYGMYFQININKMVAALKVGKTIEEIAVMEKHYRDQYEADKSEKNYRLMLWACKVREGQRMLDKKVYQYGGPYEGIRKMIAEKVLTS
jgi:ABC-type dipeptide/oligopeptide/nickel transport system ATPase component